MEQEAEKWKFKFEADQNNTVQLNEMVKQLEKSETEKVKQLEKREAELKEKTKEFTKMESKLETLKGKAPNSSCIFSFLAFTIKVDLSLKST